MSNEDESSDARTDRVVRWTARRSNCFIVTHGGRAQVKIFSLIRELNGLSSVRRSFAASRASSYTYTYSSNGKMEEEVKDGDVMVVYFRRVSIV